MSKWTPYLFALLLLGAGFALGHYAMPGSQRAPSRAPSPPPPKQIPFPPKQTQTRLPEPLARPSPTRSSVLEPLLETLREPDAFTRLTRLAETLPGLDADAVPEVRATLEDYSLALGLADFDLLLRFWATHDPAGAAMWAQLKSPTAFRDAAIMASVETWAAADPHSAYEHLQAISFLPSQSARAAEIALVHGWFASGLPGLDEYLLGLGLGERRQRAIGIFARKKIQRDGAAAIVRWAESVPADDKKLKLDVNRQVARELAMTQPAVAVAFCHAHCDGPFGSNVRASIAQFWAFRDGLAAMEWIRTEPAGQERDWAVRGAYRGWTRADPDGFWEWVEAMGIAGVEPWFEPVLEDLPKPLLAKDPTAAMAWASAIRDPKARETLLVLLAKRWRHLDAAAADAWLEESPLSEAARAQVLDPKPPAKRQQTGDATDPML